jgi:hypothetical protein
MEHVSIVPPAAPAAPAVPPAEPPRTPYQRPYIPAPPSCEICGAPVRLTTSGRYDITHDWHRHNVNVDADDEEHAPRRRARRS